MKTQLAILVALLITIGAMGAQTEKHNVLFLAVDDMNDWTSVLRGYAGRVLTPNQDRLARMGMRFTNAHTASPVCCPSRAAVMLGKRPSTTGIYNNGQWWKPHLPDGVTLPMHFRAHGYEAVGAGKIFHHTAGNNPPSQWDSFQRLVFNDDPWFRGQTFNYPWSHPTPYPEGYPFCEIKGVPHEFDWGALPGKAEADYDDARTADFAIRYLQQEHDKPFFLAYGIFHPHLPWYVPQKYLDLYPTLSELSDLPLPEGLDGQSLQPLLRDPGYAWERPAIIEYIRGQTAVRSKRWRYIRYRDGTEELYDHHQDQNEWTNLATNEALAEVKSEHASWIPKRLAPSAPSKSAYRFDPASYSWTDKKTGQVIHGLAP